MSQSKLKKSEKIKLFLKRNIYLILLAVCLVAVGIVLVTNAKSSSSVNNIIEETNSTPTSAAAQSFGLPVEKVNVVRDYSAEHIEYKPMNQWATHKAVDFGGAEGTKVFSVLDGTVKSVTTSKENGVVVVIEHAGGFTSSYGSLAENVLVKAGDKVKKGDQIGAMGTTAGNETDLGVHLHFALLKNGEAIDPNLYLSLSNK